MNCAHSKIKIDDSTPIKRTRGDNNLKTKESIKPTSCVTFQRQAVQKFMGDLKKKSFKAIN